MYVYIHVYIRIHTHRMEVDETHPALLSSIFSASPPSSVCSRDRSDVPGMCISLCMHVNAYVDICVYIHTCILQQTTNIHTAAAHLPHFPSAAETDVTFQVYTCIGIYVFVHIYTYIRMNIYIFVRVYLYIHTAAATDVTFSIYQHIYVYMHMCISRFICTYEYVYMNIYIYICVCIEIHTWYVYIYIYTDIYIYIYIYIYTHIYYVYICEYVYISMLFSRGLVCERTRRHFLGISIYIHI